ncbi:MAG TPA: hypothetical protein VNN19_07910 [bacterium]|nr:hypothetical protein [bacterium]
MRGVVRSARGCLPLRGARLEIWLAGPAGVYGDDWRATVIADEAGRYRFESHTPPAYAGRPPHIHLRATAARHRPLVTQYYPVPGSVGGVFDLVLQPAP